MTTQTLDTQMPELPQAARLHLARYLAGLEMQELSRLTGISRGTIANYENLAWDKRRTPAYIRLWAMATGASYDWLMGAAPSPGDGESVMHRRNAQSTGNVLLGRFRPEAVPATAAEAA